MIEINQESGTRGRGSVSIRFRTFIGIRYELNIEPSQIFVPIRRRIRFYRFGIDVGGRLYCVN